MEVDCWRNLWKPYPYVLCAYKWIVCTKNVKDFFLIYGVYRVLDSVIKIELQIWEYGA